MTLTSGTLGALLRRLIDHLDGAVEQAYGDAGLDYRPRFTPIVRTLLSDGPATIRILSARTGVSHSAASQTVAQMSERGLVSLKTGRDARERIVALTPAAIEMIPRLEACWRATEAAARTLDDDLGQPLTAVLDAALEALERRPFTERLKSVDTGAAE
jgi:MarR family transcriptional regulator, organic hydroperoxide resistance regulator